MTLPNSWKPKQLPDLVRLGSKHDGGYVVPERVIKQTRTVVSLGICDNWSFESDFVQRNPSVRIQAYDPSLTTKFWIQRIGGHLYAAISGGSLRRLTRVFDYLSFRRFFGAARRQIYRRKIGYASSGDLTIDGLMGGVEDDGVFLKVDIEGWEYRVLDQIPKYSSRYVGLSFEFHDVDLMQDRIRTFLESMRDHFIICWFHGNNFGGVNAQGDPISIELTLMRKSMCTPEEADGRGSDSGQQGLDAPNDPGAPEISLNWGAPTG